MTATHTHGRPHTTPPDLVQRLLDADRGRCRLTRLADRPAPPLPRIAAVHEAVELLRRALFIGYFERREVTPETLREHVARLLERVREILLEQIAAALRHAGPQAHDRPDPATLADDFLDRLPTLRARLALDVQAAYDGDPAATSIDEVVLCYPGVDAVFAHRLAHALHTLRIPLIPRIIAELAHSRTAIDIHPGARIGDAFFIDHGAGVTIGETAVIGDNVKIYQGVTLGAKSFPRDHTGAVLRSSAQRHPTIGARVTIYADAVILGGDTVVGDDCVVSGSVFLTSSVPPGHIVRAKQPELVLRSNPDAERRTPPV